MEEIFNNLTDLEKRIMDFVQGAGFVTIGKILNYVPNNNTTEFLQNTVRDLVNKEALIMKQSPISNDWTYELSYFYKNYKKLM
jgi:hypothetical protein